MLDWRSIRAELGGTIERRVRDFGGAISRLGSRHAVSRHSRVVAGAVTALCVAACSRAPHDFPPEIAPSDTVRFTEVPSVSVTVINIPPLEPQPELGYPGGPENARVPAVVVGCARTAVVVKLTSAALGGATDHAAITAAMRRVSAELLAPVRRSVGSTSISPAIRTFRVLITDSSVTRRVLTQLRKSPKVESASLDECAVMNRR